MYLLQPPQVIELSRFTSLPPEFRQRTRSLWADANRTGRATDSFLEGPVFDHHGNLYVTDIPFGRIFRTSPIRGQTGLHDPSGRLYRRRPSGQLDLLLNNVPSPNGVCLSPDESVVYLAVTRGNCVWRVPLLADGSVAKVGQFFTSYGPSGPDGLAADEQGRVVVANPGLGYVWVLNARAEPVWVLRGPAGASTTNIAFGGEGRKRLFVADSTHGDVLFADMDAAGLPIHRGPGAN